MKEITKKIITEQKIDLIIIDKHDNKTKSYAKLMTKFIKTVVISDVRKIDYHADLLINAFIGFENSITQNPLGTKCLLGPKYQILNKKYDDLAYGSLYAGLGFGNTSTTLGHALSYVFSNEGISHGHALAFTTTVAHRFNGSMFYNKYKNLVRKLNFEEINLKQNIEDAANLVLLDRKHLDNNPKGISKHKIIKLLKIICDGKSFDDSS